MRLPLVHERVDDFLQVRHQPHHNQREHPQVRPHQDWLVFVVADDPHPVNRVQPREPLCCPFEPGAELRVLDVVDGTMEGVTGIERHPATHGPHVRMVIRPEEDIRNAPLLRNDAEKAAHSYRSLC